MIFFGTRKKVLDLEYENKKLQEKVKELQEIIKNRGYKIPELKTLRYIEESKWVVKTHYSSIINAMNAKGIEIVSAKIDERDKGYSYGDAWFTIEYKLPPNMKSASFECIVGSDNYLTKTYESNFKFVYDDGTKRNANDKRMVQSYS